MARRLSVDESAFDTITEASAYWAGFLMADGCITDPVPGKTKDSASIRLALAERDRDHIVKFRDFLGSTHKILDRPASIHGNSMYMGATGLSIYVVGSERLTQALIRFGVGPRKTFTARVVQLEHDRHFWRGAIDGDGTLGYWNAGRNGNPAPMIRLGGAFPLIEQFAAFVRTFVPECKMAIRPMKSIFSAGLCGRYARRVIAELYSPCSIALDRKLIKADEILRYFPSDPPRAKKSPVSAAGKLTMSLAQKLRVLKYPITDKTRLKMSESQKKRQAALRAQRIITA